MSLSTNPLRNDISARIWPGSFSLVCLPLMGLVKENYTRLRLDTDGLSSNADGEKTSWENIMHPSPQFIHGLLFLNSMKIHKLLFLNSGDASIPFEFMWILFWLYFVCFDSADNYNCCGGTEHRIIGTVELLAKRQNWSQLLGRQADRGSVGGGRGER